MFSVFFSKVQSSTLFSYVIYTAHYSWRKLKFPRFLQKSLSTQPLPNSISTIKKNKTERYQRDFLRFFARDYFSNSRAPKGAQRNESFWRASVKGKRKKGGGGWVERISFKFNLYTLLRNLWNNLSSGTFDFKTNFSRMCLFKGRHTVRTKAKV